MSVDRSKFFKTLGSQLLKEDGPEVFLKNASEVLKEVIATDYGRKHEVIELLRCAISMILDENPCYINKPPFDIWEAEDLQVVISYEGKNQVDVKEGGE